MNTPIAPLTLAFHAGIRAGNDAADSLGEVAADTPFLVRLQYFWLKVGASLAASILQAGPAAIDAFAAGALTRRPESDVTLVLHSPTTRYLASAGAGPGGGLDTLARADLAERLTLTARKVRDGLASGPVRDEHGQLIGDLSIRAWN